MSLGLLAALLVIVLASTVSGLTGFGLAVVGVPLLLVIYDPATVVVIVASMSLFVNAVIVQDSWREVDLRSVLMLLPPAAVGVFLGTEVLTRANPEYIRLSVGVIVVFSAVLLLREVSLPGVEGFWGTILAGTTSGTLSTSTGIGGPPIVLLFAARNLPKIRFRASNAAYFFFLSVVALATLVIRGIAQPSHFWIVAALIPASFVGKMLGTVLVKRLSNEGFRKITLGIVLLTGSLGIMTATLALL